MLQTYLESGSISTTEARAESQMRRWRTLLAIYSLAQIPCASAEPTPAVKYLMDTPVSSMDFGLYRLGQRLEVKGRRYEGVLNPADESASASYDWDRNRIEVGLLVWLSQETATAAVLKGVCKTAINDSRLYGGVDTHTGKPMEGLRTAADLFTPDAFRRANQPENLTNEILAIINLKALVYLRAKDGTLRPAMSCEGPLLGTETLFQE